MAHRACVRNGFNLKVEELAVCISAKNHGVPRQNWAFIVAQASHASKSIFRAFLCGCKPCEKQGGAFGGFVVLSFQSRASFGTPIRDMAFAHHPFVSGFEMSSVSDSCFCSKMHSEASRTFALCCSSSSLASCFFLFLCGPSVWVSPFMRDSKPRIFTLLESSVSHQAAKVAVIHC